MSKTNRYAVVLDAFVYADSDEQAIEKANKIKEFLLSLDDNQASVLSIHEQQFGKIGEGRKVK